MSSPNELSFLPDDYLERKAQRRTNAICAGLFLVTLIAIGSTFHFSERSNRDVDKTYDLKLREFTAEAKRIQQAEQMQEKQRTMARQAELAASLLEKVPRSFILAEITNAMPPGVSLMDFVLESKKRNLAPPQSTVGATAFEQRKATEAQKKANAAAAAANQQMAEMKLYDVGMKLTGIAPTDVQVAQFIRKLNGSKLLKDVNMVITDEFTQDGEPMRKFVVECTLDPTAEVQPGESRPGENKTAATEIQPK
ncbi:MAG: PilN domain-containing protein [Anaerolineae bacterium]|nr:PilN domain-containing protein [Phycisphaerae bacterium]